MTPTTSRIIENCIYVADVDRAAEWYRQIFGFTIIFQQGDRLRALHVGQEQALLLFKQGASLSPIVMPGGVLPPHDGSGTTHIAFAMRTAEAEEWEQHLSTHGINIESRVHWARGGTSLYFRDPDGNSLEVATPGLWPNH